MRRLGVTTTRHRAMTLASAVRAQQCEPVLLPCIEVVPRPADELEKARDLAGSADRMVVTSPRTVATLWPQGDMPRVPVAAVGERTAEAVERAGGTVVLTGEAGADALIAGLPEDWSGLDVFFPHGSAAGPMPTHRVRPTAMAVYDTIPIAPEDDPIDAAIFGSPSAVAGWVMSRSLEDLVLGAIGRTTAESLAAHGHSPHVVPDHPGYETLIALVATHLTERSSV